MFDTIFLAAANHLLKQSGWARHRLTPYAGHTARIDLVPLKVRFSITADGYLAAWHGDDTEADVALTLPLADTPLMLTEGFQGLMQRAHIEGRAEFADTIGFVFRHLHWDIEEDLSRIIGDIAAHRIANAGRALSEVPRKLWNSANGNLTDYLAEESAFLISRAPHASLSSDITALAQATTHLDERINRLADIRS